MATLHTLSASGALTDVNVKLSVDRPAGNLHLKLAGHLGLVNRAAAARTSSRQVRLMHLVDLVRRRSGAERGCALVGTGLSTRFLRIGLGRSLGKGRRLSFVAPQGLVQQPLQLGHAGLKFRDAALQHDATWKIGLSLDGRAIVH